MAPKVIDAGGVRGVLVDVQIVPHEGLAQTGAYVDRCAAEAGHLIVFDRFPERTWEQKIFRRVAPPGNDAPVTVWGM